MNPHPHPPADASRPPLGNRFITCGDSFAGSNIGAPDLDNDGLVGDAMFIVTLFSPMHLTIDTCDDRTNFVPSLKLFDGSPKANASTTHSTRPSHSTTLLAQSENSTNGCSAIFYDVPSAGAYYLLVNSEVPDVQGIFVLSLLCHDLPITAVPDTCAQTFLTCGDSRIGTNADRFDSLAGSKSPEAFYVVTVFEPVALIITTCSSQTDFPTNLVLYDSAPTVDDRFNATILASHDPDHPCVAGSGGGATMFFMPEANTSYYLMIEGIREHDKGVFEVSMLCTDSLAAPVIAEPCNMTNATVELDLDDLCMNHTVWSVRVDILHLYEHS